MPARVAMVSSAAIESTADTGSLRSTMAAAEAIAVAGYFNAGQDCTAATRVLAAPGAYDDFVAALTEQAKNTKTGAPDDEDILYGALNNSTQLDHVSGMVERLPGHAEVTAGGQKAGNGSAPARRSSRGIRRRRSDTVSRTASL